ncbi:aldehyde dehydrogenase family protein [Algoriphagus sp. H41]|uniref:Aldehyde dehydrogenase n=1 Tax=Algoriphagus oliviformis TaxID=2811231 RepID=A0ABS3C095_9BACT|nr:aldehyde dehydrogenase family protein [Algoriphagus oliviformis]MBN7809566.1 aldehyde dehydrogenase family protein [Algoriphagus oliviformis]
MDTDTLPQTDFRQIFQAQRQTAEAWRRSTTEERIDRLVKIGDWIRSNQKTIREALWQDFKKPEVESDLSEIFPVTSEINHAKKNLKSWMKPSKASMPMPMFGTSSHIQYEPKGCSLIIAPWNYPFNLTIGPLVSALAAGCTAIIKPSELTPNTSALIAKMVEELFTPEEVTVCLGGAEVSQALLSLPFDHIFFTGSPKIGKIVMAAAAKHLTSVTLELGGKSPTIVTQSADIPDAAKKIAFGKFVNAGQTCIAPDYILVHESRKKELVAELTIAIRDMYDPKHQGIEKSPDLARIIDSRHFGRLSGYLREALDQGAKLEFGGGIVEGDLYIEPTLLSQTSEDMAISQEEIFGPLLPILGYQTLQEAIDYVNQKPKPLALYVFGSGTESAEVLEKTSSGNAVVNDCVLHFMHHNLPFGGIGNSGLGKSHGEFGFLAFSNEKGVLKQRVGFNNVTLLRPPYGVKAKKIIASLIKWF